MDFKRIQKLLIFFFVLFDVYLLFLVARRLEVIDLESPITVENSIEAELENRGISFDPFDNSKGEFRLVKSDQTNYLAENISQLANQNASLDANKVLSSEFDQPVDLDLGLDANAKKIDPEAFARFKQTYLEDPHYFIEGQEYINYWYLPSERAIIVRMTDGEGHSIVDGSAEIRISLNEHYQMTKYKQTYQSNIKQLSTNVETISQRTAVGILDRRVETFIPNDARITVCRVSYYQSKSLKDFNVYSPAWEIIYELKDGKSKSLLVDGHRGTVLNQLSPTYN